MLRFVSAYALGFALTMGCASGPDQPVAMESDHAFAHGGRTLNGFDYKTADRIAEVLMTYVTPSSVWEENTRNNLREWGQEAFPLIYAASLSIQPKQTPIGQLRFSHWRELRQTAGQDINNVPNEILDAIINFARATHEPPTPAGTPQVRVAPSVYVAALQQYKVVIDTWTRDRLSGLEAGRFLLSQPGGQSAFDFIAERYGELYRTLLAPWSAQASKTLTLSDHFHNNRIDLPTSVELSFWWREFSGFSPNKPVAPTVLRIWERLLPKPTFP